VGGALIKKLTQKSTQELISPCVYVPFSCKKIDVFFPGDRQKKSLKWDDGASSKSGKNVHFYLPTALHP
jgi:hypothetical protein